ncbi:MAG: DUF1566 domain-containing protein [Bacteroidaceae bacterium]|nr:DUF1566 domain-containing protein [Bacteroidaceae bacterium]
MKKSIFAFMALAATFAATSCQSDEEPTLQLTGKPMVINAVAEGIGTGTRASMAYKYDILWSEDDEIYVMSSTDHETFTLKTGQGTTNGTFECQSSPFESGDEVEAFYPASLVDNGNLVWPAQQTTSTVVPMYSKNTLGGTGTENFSFASLGAMLQIVFTTPQADVTLKSITIKDDDATMSGTFTVDENGKAGITATDKAGITLDLGEGVAVSNKIQYFNIAVPAGTYSNLSITFTAIDKSTCTLKGNVTINHNTVGKLTLTGKEFKSTFCTGKAEAKGIGKVRWVQLWDGGPKFAEFNVGVTDGKEESFGGYYCWGSSINKDSNAAFKSGTDALTGTDDTATNLWGSNWRMPTQKELAALLNQKNCICTWTENYKGTGVNGLLCTGKDAYSSNSVFLPAAGYCYGGDVRGQGNYGHYWSSTPYPYESSHADNLCFNSGDLYVSYYYCGIGISVRAVLAE